MTDTMRAVLWTEPDRMVLEDVPRPQVPAGWVLVRTELTGLCGTDFSILRGTHPRAEAPQIMGHEMTGVIVERNGAGPPIGTRVTVEPLISCGVCPTCVRGHAHVCQQLGLYGIDQPGSLAEFVALPAEAVLPFSSGVSAKDAALAEPLAVAAHAVERAELTSAQRVVVFGAGPIGILTALVVRFQGVKSVLIVEPSKQRRRVAEELGFEVIESGEETVSEVLAATDGVGADVVFDSAAHPAVAAMLPAVTRPRGSIVLVGVYKEPAPIDLQAVTFGEQTLLGVRVYTRANMETAVQLIESDALGLARLPIRVFPFEQAQRAFEHAMSAGATLKVLMSADEALMTPEEEL